MYSFVFCLFIELPVKKKRKKNHNFLNNKKRKKKKKKKMHWCGIEPGNSRSQVLNLTTGLNDKLK